MKEILFQAFERRIVEECVLKPFTYNVRHFLTVLKRFIRMAFSSGRIKSKCHRQILVKKLANPGLFFVNFRSFQTNNTILQQINVKKCPSSIQLRDSNPQPFEHKLSPVTSRPGLLHNKF